MKDQFANYVVQKVLETCDDQQLELILNRIKVHLNALKKYTYGKHIVARVEKLVAAGGIIILLYYSLKIFFFVIPSKSFSLLFLKGLFPLLFLRKILHLVNSWWNDFSSYSTMKAFYQTINLALLSPNLWIGNVLS